MRQLPWMRDVVVGSVLKDRNGTMRVVRKVTRYRDALQYVTFTIRSCSWTGRCYTVLTATDLRLRGFTLVRVAPRTLETALDRKIDAAIHQFGGGDRSKYILRCCDVEGVA